MQCILESSLRIFPNPHIPAGIRDTRQGLARDLPKNHFNHNCVYHVCRLKQNWHLETTE